MIDGAFAIEKVDQKANDTQSREILSKRQMIAYQRSFNHKDAVLTIEELKSGEIVTGSLDTNLKVWNYETGKCKKTYKGHTHGIIIIQELQNGNLASSSLDKTIILWNRISGEIINTLEGFETPITSMIRLNDD